MPKGDFSRQIFDPKKHYRQVLSQQGRVQLDADSNEQADIVAYQDETRMLDLVGGCGGPLHNAAFGITPAAGQDFTLSAGHYYVDGILCENDAGVRFFGQPDLPLNKSAVLAALQAGFYIAYLDVWQRHLTALDDPQIREVALGGPDTTTRVKTVWQVKLARVSGVPGLTGITPPNCLTASEEFNSKTAPSTGTMTASQAAPAPGGDNLCIVPPGAGYQGLENQLYRVEIHTGGAAGAATFKWSHDNGAVVTTLERINGREVTVRDLGPDAVLGFDRDQWVEISDDVRELNGLPGELRQIEDVDPSRRVLILKAAATPLASNANGVEPRFHPKLRRWDHAGTVQSDGALSTSGTHELEFGVQVAFAGSLYHTGDYWLIPARTASADAQSGNIEWPRDGAGNFLAQPPRGIRHHYCKLAVLQFAGAAGFTLVQDCRNLFPPVTELIQLFYAGGDGQEVRPDIAATAGGAVTNRPLPAPLAVGVSNGRWPVQRARVRFQTATGVISAGTRGVPLPQVNPRILDVTTDANGMADCRWSVSSEAQHDMQTLTATLLDAAGQPTVHIPITFTAALRRASGVSYQPGECDDLKGVTNVQDALDELCKRRGGGCTVTVGEGGDFRTLNLALETLLRRGQFDICICMLPGSHVVEHFRLLQAAGGVIFNNLALPTSQPPKVRLKIEGCGVGTRVVWKRAPVNPDVDDPLLGFSLVLCTAFVMRDVEVSMESGFIGFQCDTVAVESCALSQRLVLNDQETVDYWTGSARVLVGLLVFVGCNHIRVVDCRMRQFIERQRFLTFEPFIDVHPPLATLYADVPAQNFANAAGDAAQDVNRQTSAKRAALAARLREVAAPFNAAARGQFEAMAGAIQAGTLKGGTGETGSLGALRNVQIAAQSGANLVREGTTVVLNDGRAKATIHDNVLEGALCVYGRSPSPWIRLSSHGWPGRIFRRVITFNDGGGDLSVKNNRLSRVAIGTDMTRKLDQLDDLPESSPAAARQIVDIFRVAVYEGNDIKSPINQFMACFLSLSSNVLTKLPLNQTLAPRFRSHLAVARQAAYVANHGAAVGTALTSVTGQNETEEAANINLEVVTDLTQP